MTIGNQPKEIREAERYDLLVTPEFAPLAEFAGFGAYEAVAIQETGREISALIDRIPGAVSEYLTMRPESASLMGGSDLPVSEPLIKEWLDRTIAGPFDGELAAFIRQISHAGGKEVTFPGVQVPLPPQLVLALTAWLQGQILEAMGETCDLATVSAAGAAWMNQFMLQLGIILAPTLAEPDSPLGRHEAAEFHPYAEFAGFGAKETSILRKTGPLLGPAAGGVVTLAYDYLLSRPESGSSAVSVGRVRGCPGAPRIVRGRPSQVKGAFGVAYAMAQAPPLTCEPLRPLRAGGRSGRGPALGGARRTRTPPT